MKIKQFVWDFIWGIIGNVWYIAYSRGKRAGLIAMAVIGFYSLDNYIKAIRFVDKVPLDHPVYSLGYSIVTMTVFGLITALILRNVPREEAKFSVKFKRAFKATVPIVVMALVFGGMVGYIQATGHNPLDVTFWTVDYSPPPISEIPKLGDI